MYQRIFTAHTTDPRELDSLLSQVGARAAIADEALAERWYVEAGYAPELPPPGRIREMASSTAEAAGVSMVSVFLSAQQIMSEAVETAHAPTDPALVVVGTPEQAAATLAAAVPLSVALLGSVVHAATHGEAHPFTHLLPQPPAPTLIIDAFIRSAVALSNVDQETVLGALRTPRGLASLDQVSAASNAAVQHSLALVESGRVSRASLIADATPGWVQLGALDATTGWVTGTVRTCPCEPSPQRMQPLFAATWAPGLVTCAPCVYLLDAALDDVADTACAACGFSCLLVEISRVAVNSGPLTYLIGLCEHCFAEWPGEVSA